jgi:hypothetical protein
MVRPTDLTSAIVEGFMRSLPRNHIQANIVTPGYKHPIYFPFHELMNVPNSKVYICRVPLPATKKARFITKIQAGMNENKKNGYPYLAPGKHHPASFQIHNDIAVHRLWHERFAKGDHCHVGIPQPFACGNLNGATKGDQFPNIGDVFYACFEYIDGEDLATRREPFHGTQWTFQQRRAFVRQMALHRIHCLKITSDYIGAPIEPRFFDNITFHLSKADRVSS